MFPQAPQLLASVAGVTHCPLQQTPGMHVTPQPPQFKMSLLTSTQAPLQYCLGRPPEFSTQTHWPPRQCVPTGQTCPQVPQLSLSVWVSTQKSPHGSGNKL